MDLSAIAPAIRATVRRGSRLRRVEWAFLALLAGPLLAFLLLPWPLEGKGLAVLHGLCAQQPTHSFYYGGQRLPFDARMTGIYSGFALSALFLLARGRWRAGGLPPVRVLAMLGAGVVLMGLDGANSTLLDMRLWHAYAPRNELRLATGLATGAALCVFVWLLLGQIAFAPSPARRRPMLSGLREALALAAALTAGGAAIASGWGPLRAPLTLLLIAAAVVAVAALMLAFVLLVSGRENRARLARELAGPAAVALLAAYVVIGASAGGRFALELLAGVQTARGG